ncbi:MAG: gephyrin-like molybdotransferase Glp [Chloroflexota bacterium]
MPRELFNVLTPPDALQRLLDHLTVRSPSERVLTADALDRVLAEDLDSPADLPSFPRSTMDGFAVRAADTHGATEGLPAYLTLVGEVLMGRRADITLGIGQAARIATGGMVPPGADAVVMVEQTQEASQELIEVLRPVASGENVIQIGEDVARGNPLLRRGHTLRSQDLGGLLAMGVTRVAVTQKARVGIISSGDEVIHPEQEPEPGQIRDINSYTLAALIRHAGHEPYILGIVPDDYGQLAATARAALDQHDVLILSAGSSVSTRDMTSEVIAALGSPGVLVHGVSLRPGKPTILAVADNKPVFGLPGNPVSCMVTFDLFVAPTLAHLCGQQQVPRTTRRARLTRNIASATGREDYVQVRLEQRDGEPWAEPVFGKSNLIYTLVRSDGMVKVELNQGGLVEGAWVDVILF